MVYKKKVPETIKKKRKQEQEIQNKKDKKRIKKDSTFIPIMLYNCIKCMFIDGMNINKFIKEHIESSNGEYSCTYLEDIYLGGDLYSKIGQTNDSYKQNIKGKMHGHLKVLNKPEVKIYLAIFYPKDIKQISMDKTISYIFEQAILKMLGRKNIKPILGDEWFNPFSKKDRQMIFKFVHNKLKYHLNKYNNSG